MSAGRRVSITFYSALVLAIVAVGLERSEGIGDPNAWLVAFVAASALAVVGVFFVYRWWALLPAVTTVTAFCCGQGLGAFGELLASEWAPLFFFFPILIGIAVLSVGLLARVTHDQIARSAKSREERG